MTVESDSPQGKALRPRARIMRTLGEELISSEVVAVIELVKNSYDAEAGYVSIRFDGKLEVGEGSVSIEDDGHGMSLTVVEGSWMEPATNNKKVQRSSHILKRRFLGEKGVGRFAAARLATDLELTTRALESDKEVYAYFDWSQFDNEDAYLDQILILAEERVPQEFVRGRTRPFDAPGPHGDLRRDGSHGTLLKMNGLKRAWGDKEVYSLKKSLSRLISPFDGEKGFKIFIQLPGDYAEQPRELEPPEVLKYPHYTLSGRVDKHGDFEFRAELHASSIVEAFTGKLVNSDVKDRGVVEFVDGKGGRPLVCGPFSFNILVWDRDQLDNIDQKLGTGIHDIRRDLDSIAGVSIFRDGFRVLPYGEAENDWLKLDIRRVQNPTMRLSNNQITGYVKIGADENPLLKDQSNREGLDNNSAYSELQEIIRLALSKLESLRFRDKKSAGADDASRKSDGALLAVPDTAKLRQLISTGADSAETLHLFDETTKAWENQVGRIREVLSRYHSLATLGQLVDKVVHDGRQPLSTIQTQSSLLIESLSKALKKLDGSSECGKYLEGIHARLLRVKDAAGLIDLVLKRIEPLGGRKKGRPTKVYINEIIKNAFSHFQADIESLGINVTLPAADDLIQVDAHELQEVLINLIANSVYWLSNVPKGQRAILVQCTRPAPRELDIIFADSGPGVSKGNKSAIFEPYFSTKPDGVGLGLVIAGEMIRDYYNGSLELLNSGPLPGAVFRIKLRKRV
ncbi:ATP-binding protein [Delftia sp. K82]|uniref:sensor histidine kinase n=1 Tax=Delftia sp. K82 TaxID=1472718 RepID=UPI001178ACFB|nr:ATP-binding protein [Delftia sp. K82]